MNKCACDIEQTIEKRARFDIIRYSNCWEDADILLLALNVKQGGSYLSIASAGDNSLSILSKNPSKVFAVDINPLQLACLEIRKAAFKYLSYEDTLVFLGIKGGNRLNLYKYLRRDLPDDAREFWDRHKPFIKQGVLHIGKFERYFQLFRKYILPLIHNKETIKQLLTINNREERINFYKNRWDTGRWKLLFKLFFNRLIMGKFGRDPEFFKYVQINVPASIFRRVEYALTELETNQNPYLEYILAGNFRNSLPFYLRKENFESIRNNLDKLVIFKGDLEKVFEAYPQIKFDGFNLSDIFEYISPDEYKKELERILERAMPKARLVYWNMLVERKCADGLEKRIKFLDEESCELFKQDKAFFYKSLIIAEKIERE